VHHASAQRYWKQGAADRVAFCRITALALLRLVTNAHVMRKRAFTSAQAWEWYSHLLAMPAVVFLSEPATLHEQLGELAVASSFDSGSWTDAYLAAFAIAGDYRFVTFDRGFDAYRDLRLLQLEG